jgi:hypothetical protein
MLRKSFKLGPVTLLTPPRLIGVCVYLVLSGYPILGHVDIDHGARLHEQLPQECLVHLHKHRELLK